MRAAIGVLSGLGRSGRLGEHVDRGAHPSPKRCRRCERVASPLASVRSWSGRPFRRCSPKRDETTDPPSSARTRGTDPVRGSRSRRGRRMVAVRTRIPGAGPTGPGGGRVRAPTRRRFICPPTRRRSSRRASPDSPATSRSSRGHGNSRARRSSTASPRTSSRPRAASGSGTTACSSPATAPGRKSRGTASPSAPRRSSCWKREHGHGEASEVSSSGRRSDHRERRVLHDVQSRRGRLAHHCERSRVRPCRVDAGTAQEHVARIHGPAGVLPALDQLPAGQPAQSRDFLTPDLRHERLQLVSRVTVPYYFNLAPNYDATLTARTMSDRGVQAQGEFRHLSRTYGRSASSRWSTCRPIPSSTTIAPHSISCTGNSGRTGGRRTPDWSGCRTPRITKTWERASRRAAGRISPVGSMRATGAIDGTHACGSRTS